MEDNEIRTRGEALIEKVASLVQSDEKELLAAIAATTLGMFEMLDARLTSMHKDIFCLLNEIREEKNNVR
jgi:hypothetical protein